MMAKCRKWPTFEEKRTRRFINQAMPQPLHERQILVIEAMNKRLSNQKTLEYLKQFGYDISNNTLKRDRKKIRDNALPRLYAMAKIGYVDQHINRIDKMEMIEKEMWANYENITDPYKAILALEKIANLQPILSAYYDSSRYVLEKSNMIYIQIR